MILNNKTNPNITLNDVKRHLYVDHDLDNNLLEMYLQSAIAWCSEYIGIYPYGCSYVASIEELNSGDLKSLELEYRPYLVEIQTSGDSEFLNKQDIDLIYSSETQELIVYSPEASSIKAEVGFSGSRGQERIKMFNQAVLLTVGDYYKYREDTNTLSLTSLPQGTIRLLNQIQVDI